MIRIMLLDVKEYDILCLEFEHVFRFWAKLV